MTLIGARVGDRLFALVDGRIEVGEGSLPAEFRRPQLAVRSRHDAGTEETGPVNEREQFRAQPGTPEHFRAAVRKLGGTIEVDTDD